MSNEGEAPYLNADDYPSELDPGKGPIICKLCGCDFPTATPLEISTTQGIDCASSIYEHDGTWFVAGSYGSSKYDTEVWKFVEGDDLPKEAADPVCDRCIDRMIVDGRLVIVNDHAVEYDPLDLVS